LSRKATFIRPFQTSIPKYVSCEDAESEYLRAQRKLRPTSPHLSIYQPQLTWYMSSAHRITGVALGGGMYSSLFTLFIKVILTHLLGIYHQLFILEYWHI
jgi:hypothetical protein